MMKHSDKEIETLITGIYRSQKTRKALTAIALVGMAACALLLLPPVQSLVLQLIMARRPLSVQAQTRLIGLLSLSMVGFFASALLLCCVFSEKIASALAAPKNSAIILRASAALAGLLLVFIAVFSYRYGRHWLNSDLSSEMILAKLLAEEHSLVSPNFYYANELRLVYHTLFSAPLFALLGRFNNWALIRVLTIVLNHITFIASYFFFMKQTKTQTKWICISTLFLLLPLTVTYHWDNLTFGGFYIFSIAQMFCCIGLFLRILSRIEKAEPSKITLIFFSVLSIVLGIQGIRALLYVHIPLLLACVYAFWSNRAKKLPLALGLYGFLLCGAGFIINNVLHIKYIFRSYDGMGLSNLAQTLLVRTGQIIAALPKFFGFESGHKLLSTRGMFCVFSLFFAAWIIIAAIRLLPSRKARQGGETSLSARQWTVLFFVCSLAFNIFLFQIISQTVIERYFVPFLIFYAPLLGFLFENIERRYDPLPRIAVMAAVCIFILGQGVLTFRWIAKNDLNNKRNGYIAYLSANKLRYGFASYWNANVTTELTNGEIELVGLEPNVPARDGRFRIFDWYIPVRFYNPEYHQGESFLLLTNEQWELARQNGRPFSQKQPDFNDGAFIVIRYPSAKLIHESVLD
jgi:hypothetical protein